MSCGQSQGHVSAKRTQVVYLELKGILVLGGIECMRCGLMRPMIPWRGMYVIQSVCLCQALDPCKKLH